MNTIANYFPFTCTYSFRNEYTGYVETFRQTIYGSSVKDVRQRAPMLAPDGYNLRSVEPCPFRRCDNCGDSCHADRMIVVNGLDCCPDCQEAVSESYA